MRALCDEMNNAAAALRQWEYRRNDTITQFLRSCLAPGPGLLSGPRIISEGSTASGPPRRSKHEETDGDDTWRPEDHDSENDEDDEWEQVPREQLARLAQEEDKRIPALQQATTTSYLSGLYDRIVSLKRFIIWTTSEGANKRDRATSTSHLLLLIARLCSRTIFS